MEGPLASLLGKRKKGGEDVSSGEPGGSKRIMRTGGYSWLLARLAEFATSLGLMPSSPPSTAVAVTPSPSTPQQNQPPTLSPSPVPSVHLFHSSESGQGELDLCLGLDVVFPEELEANSLNQAMAMTITSLKARLKEQSLPQTGCKTVLASRLAPILATAALSARCVFKT